jgi:uncharacterized integral membrane protein (TIGR00697 family)
MNETLFILHLVVVSACTLFAFRKGKTALTAWICLQAVLANLFVLKQVQLFGAYVTCSDVFAVGTIFGLNLLREYKGKEAAKQALMCCFFAMGFFMVMSQFHLWYAPSLYDTTQQAYETLLSPSPRLLLASLFTFFIVQQLDLRLFHLLKEKLPQTAFTWRNAFCTILSQGLDTLLFSILGLAGLVEHLSHIIVVSFLIKMVVIALMSPLIHFSKRFIPKEASDVAV